MSEQPLYVTRYPKVKPIMGVFAFDRVKRPVSYKRIYDNTWNTMQEVEKYLDNWYRQNKTGFVTYSLLAKRFDRREGTMRTVIELMAGFRKMFEVQEDKTWKCIRNIPMIVVQQMPTAKTKDFRPHKSIVHIMRPDSLRKDSKSVIKVRTQTIKQHKSAHSDEVEA